MPGILEGGSGGGMKLACGQNLFFTILFRAICHSWLEPTLDVGEAQRAPRAHAKNN